MTTDQDARSSIVQACRRMASLGINQGTSGNISLRAPGGLLLTPSGLDYDVMQPEDIVFMDWQGAWQARGSNRPSSEWRFHHAILKARPELGAVLHAHPPYCTVLAIMGRAIPAIHYMILAAGGDDIPCAPYATFGTDELSRHAVEAMARRDACLLAHHGMIAAGATLAAALWLAVEVEVLARQYHGCLQLGTPPVLPQAELARLAEHWSRYRGLSRAEADQGEATG